MRTAWFLLLPNTHILDLAGPLQVISTCPELGIAPLQVRCIGPSPQISCFQAIQLAGLEPMPAQLGEGDLLFVIGHKLLPAGRSDPLQAQAVRWLRDVAGSTADLVVCSICTAAFLLGEAGLLDERDCTTHHRYAAQLQQRFPRARVVDNQLFVQDGNLYTSAGVSTGIDLTLQLIRQHLGRQQANQVAQELVIYRRRAGNDPQLSARDLARNHIHPLIHDVQDFLEQHFTQPIVVEDLARHFNLSYRHLARLFRSHAGMTLKGFLGKLRIDHARHLLATQRIPAELLAERCGFSSSHALRLAWNKEMSLSPLQYHKLALTE
jgi:transcriptional regulator GlxA family with amidase domain